MWAGATASASPGTYSTRPMPVPAPGCSDLVFLLAEATRIQAIKEAVRALLACTRVRKDLEEEQKRLAETQAADYRMLKEAARRGGAGVPPEFMALENDLGTAMQKLGENELHVRGRILEAYRVLAFPLGAGAAEYDLFGAVAREDTLLECFRVDFGEAPGQGAARRPRPREAVAQAPILQCLRQQGKLVGDPTAENPVLLDPRAVGTAPSGSRRSGCSPPGRCGCGCGGTRSCPCC